MIKNSKIGVLIGIVAALSATSAMADNVITQASGVTHIGKRVPAGKPLRGYADDMPLLDVMKQVTPRGWVAKKSPALSRNDLKTTVSWSGGKDWVRVLEDISNNHGVDFTIDWAKKAITIEGVSAVAAPQYRVTKSSVFEMEGAAPQHYNRDGSVRGEASRTASGWHMDGEKTLKENVQNWANQAGYRLVWNGEDYPVRGHRMLSGSFEEETGPIAQLAIDYGPDSKAQVPLSFQFYENRTLVVENWMFEQTGFPQLNKPQ